MITTSVVHGEYVMSRSQVARYKNALDRQERDGIEYDSVEGTDSESSESTQGEEGA